MKKKILLAMLAGIFAINTAFAEKIPIPENFTMPEEPGAAYASEEINHGDSIYFPKIDFSKLTSTDSRIILENYPTYQQTTEYTCGPAAALTVLHFYGEKNFDEMTLAKEMKTKPFKGTDVKNLANFFEKIGWEVDSSLNHKPLADYVEFKNFVLKNLRENTPIIVENVEWGGHWRVIIGYDTLGTEDNLDDVLIMMDSYDTSDHNQDGYVVNNGWRFFSMWFDHSMFPKNQQNQPWVTARPKKFDNKN